MIAFLPKDWFFIDVEENASADIIAVAVNPDYTLAAVFSVIRNTEKNDKVIEQEGLTGLARLNLARRQRKTGGAVRQVGDFATIQMGQLSFAKYDFTAEEGGTPSQAAVFISSADKCYEFSLIPMHIKTKQLPARTDIDKIFRSILATVQY